MRRQLTKPARNDIADILDWSADNFGEAAATRYGTLIRLALADITSAEPPRGSREIQTARGPARLYHLRNVDASRQTNPVGRPRHLLAYRIVGNIILVVRVLHDAMDLPAHLDA